MYVINYSGIAGIIFNITYILNVKYTENQHFDCQKRVQHYLFTLLLIFYEDQIKICCKKL